MILIDQTSNIVQIIIDTINTLCSTLFSSIDNSIFPILDEMVFIDTSILETIYIEKILGTSSTNGLLILANALLVAIVLYYSIKLLFSYYTGTEVQQPTKFFIRAVIFGIIMNSSYFICYQIISLVSSSTNIILQTSSTLFKKDINFLSLINMLNSTLSLENNSFNIFSLDGLISGVISFGTFNLILSYSLRYIMIKVFVLLSPFAFLCLIDKNTEWFFKSWCKSFFSLLSLQLLISIILILPYAINIELNKGSSTLFNKLSLLGAIYALFKANDFIKDFMGGISTNIQTSLSNVRNIFRNGV